jgi:predicted RND superfamily exporter protein
MFNTTMDAASEDMVKVALHFLMAQSPGFKASLSKDNHTQVRDITIGPTVFEDVVVWQAKALIFAILLDYELVEEAFPEILDLEGLKLDVLDMIEGKERSIEVYGIALDITTEINKEGQSSVMLVFVAVICILIVVYFALRSGQESALMALIILMLLFWMFGSVRLLDFGSSQFIDLLLPIAILALGVDFAIHASHRYHEEKRSEPDPERAFQRSVSRVGPALFIAMVTTAVAFFSNATSELQSVQQFGVAAGLAIIFAFLLFGLFLPTVKMLLDRRKYRKAIRSASKENGAASPEKEPSKKAVGTTRTDGLWGAIARIGTRPVIVIVLVIIITIPLAYFGYNIEGRMPVEDFINSKSDFVISLDKMQEHFITGEEGKVLIQGDMSEPATLMAINDVTKGFKDNEEALSAEYLTIYDYVHNLTSNDYVFTQYGNTTLREHLGLVDDDGDGLPDTREMLDAAYQFMIGEKEGVPLLWNGIIIVRYTHLEVEESFQWGREDRLDRVLLSVRLPHSGDASKVVIAREELKKDLKLLDDMGFEYNQVSDGKYYVITDVGTLNPFTREEQFSALTSSMATAIAISIVLCLVVMVALFRSVKLGLVTIIPVCLVVAWLYGFMEITGQYLNSVTVTIAAISIGVGVDYSIHVTQRFREEYGRRREFEPAMNETLGSTGKALLASAGSTVIGFTIIGFSPMTMFSKFGFLTAIMIAMAFISAVFVLPALLSLTVRGGTDPTGQETKDEESDGDPS